MFKLFVFACILAFAIASPKPGLIAPLAYTAPVAYSGYNLPYAYSAYPYAGLYKGYSPLSYGYGYGGAYIY